MKLFLNIFFFFFGFLLYYDVIYYREKKKETMNRILALVLLRLFPIIQTRMMRGGGSDGRLKEKDTRYICIYIYLTLIHRICRFDENGFDISFCYDYR